MSESIETTASDNLEQDATADTAEKPKRSTKKVAPKKTAKSSTPSNPESTELSSAKAPDSDAVAVPVKPSVVEKTEKVVAPESGTKKKEKQSDSVKYYGTGKRKTAIARVWLMSGNGAIEINNKGDKAYLCSDRLVKVIQLPLVLLDMQGKIDIVAKAKGGGISAQADAIKAGVSRALVELNPEFHRKLKEAGHLTRDARIKERKHYGHKRARKSFQFSKR